MVRNLVPCNYNMSEFGQIKLNLSRIFPFVLFGDGGGGGGWGSRGTAIIVFQDGGGGGGGGGSRSTSCLTHLKIQFFFVDWIFCI